MDSFQPEVQHILAPALGILSATQITQMVDWLMEMHGFSKPSLSALSTPPASPLSQLEIGHTKLADDITSLQKPKWPDNVRPNTVAIYWYHTNFGVKACRFISPCSFTSKQSKRVKQVSPKAVNTSSITTFGTCSLFLDIGVRRLFLRVFVVAGISCAILGPNFLAAFDLLVDCLQSRLHDKDTDPTARGISSSDAYCKLAVLDPEPENPFRQLLIKYPGLTRPNFSTPIPPHDVVYHTRTTSPPAFSRPRRLAPARLAAANAEFEQMLQMDIIRQSETPWVSTPPYGLIGRHWGLAPLWILPAPYSASLYSRSVVHAFRQFIEGRDVTVFTDLQPLSFALKSMSDKLNHQEIRQLDYISQFTSDTRHVDRSVSEMAGALPRPSIAHLQLSPGIDLAEMAAEQRRVCSPCDDDVSELRLQDLPLTTGNGTILCDVSTTSHRPFEPPSHRRKVFSSLRHLSHPGSRATNKLVSDRFVWPGMHKELTALVRAYLGCQQNKVQQHNKAPIGTFPTPDARFRHVHLDISLLSFLGCTCIRNTAYHPTANGMVKRFHRQLKASLRAADDPEIWTDHFLVVRLGIRSSLKSDLDCSAAELVFGATVRLPGQMISPTPRVAVEDPTNLLYRLRQFMRTLSPVPPRPSVSESYLVKDLATCSHVYLRCDRVRRPLEPTYDGPFRVISHGTKNFRIQRRNREEVVSVDRLKAAVPHTSPDEPCGSYTLLLLPDPLFLFPVYFICRYARDPQLQLPPT
ncbi:hypothetical protein SprV_0501777300 [Sparganum proliferum]